MEQHLPGGFVTAVVRVGDSVRRPPSPNAAFVHDLLDHLERQGWEGAPRFLGIDAEGREVLSFLDGHVAWAPDQPAEVGSDDSLAGVARLVRQLHDLTAGTSLAGAAEVVCHNDLSPRNTVYRDQGRGLRPVAFIDWDIAAPATAAWPRASGPRMPGWPPTASGWRRSSPRTEPPGGWWCTGGRPSPWRADHWTNRNSSSRREGAMRVPTRRWCGATRTSPSGRRT